MARDPAPSPQGPRLTGAVKWFSDAKGYGFITRDDQQKDVFFHFSSINGNGFKTMAEGDRVEFSLQDTPKGPQASAVAKIG